MDQSRCAPQYPASVPRKIELLGLFHLHQKIAGAATAAGVLGKNAMVNEAENVTQCRILRAFGHRRPFG